MPDITKPDFAYPWSAPSSGRLRASHSAVLLVYTGEHPKEEARAAKMLVTMSTDLSSFRRGGCTGNSRPWARCRPCSCSVQCGSTPLPRSSGAPEQCTKRSPIWQPTAHCSLAFLGGPPGSWAATDAGELVHKASLSLGLDVAVAAAPRRRHSSCHLGPARFWAPDVTAVVAFNDQMALGVMAGSPVVELAVPGDVSVIGFDDVPMAAMVAPPRTTIGLPTEEAGSVAVVVFPEHQERRPLLSRPASGPQVVDCATPAGSTYRLNIERFSQPCCLHIRRERPSRSVP